jgi:hypothetical protein
MLIEARDKAVEMGKLKNSILNGAGNIAGFIGEAIAQKVLGGQLINTYHYDLVLPNNTTLDVKTKQTSVKPLPSYSCSIASLNTEQFCNYYCFIRVKNDFSIGWYLGVYEKEQYFKDATFLKKGSVDESNGYVVKSDCFNLPISQLKELP